MASLDRTGRPVGFHPISLLALSMIPKVWPTWRAPASMGDNHPIAPTKIRLQSRKG
jgi:hypothetical protein